MNLARYPDFAAFPSKVTDRSEGYPLEMSALQTSRSTTPADRPTDGYPLISRRALLKSMLAAATAWGATRWMSTATGVTPEPPTPASARMPTRTLGRTGHPTSLFALGGLCAVATREPKDKALAVIHRALDAGVTYIDTAFNYGHDGASEKNIGDVMGTRRHEVFLATKTGCRDYDGAMRECETSLNRLQTDYLDLYQHHYVPNAAAVDAITGPNGALRAFLKLRDEKTIQHLGITSHSPLALLLALRRHDYDCAFLTLNPARITMDDHEYLEEFMTTARDRNVGVTAMKIAGGQGGLIFRHGITMEQSLRYALSFTPVAGAVIGISEPEQVDLNAELARNFTPMTAGERHRLESSAAG